MQEETDEAAEPGRLTVREQWDEQWKKVSLPCRHARGPGSFHSILDTFDKWLPNQAGLSVLEIGGAPGGYSAYLHHRFGYQVNCLDYSPVGCEITAKNFEMQNIEGKVYQADLFSDVPALPLHDIVFSLGVVEHFEDMESAVARHLRLLKPGGILLIGMPSFIGVNHWFLKRLAPVLLSQHNLNSMRIENWARFEGNLGLTPIFKGYIGGFEPRVFAVRERRTFRSGFLYLFSRGLALILSHHLPGLRRFNSPRFSGYVMGIWRKPGAEQALSGPPAPNHPEPREAVSRQSPTR